MAHAAPASETTPSLLPDDGSKTSIVRPCRLGENLLLINRPVVEVRASAQVKMAASLARAAQERAHQSQTWPP